MKVNNVHGLVIGPHYAPAVLCGPHRKKIYVTLNVKVCRGYLFCNLEVDEPFLLSYRGAS